MDHRDPPARPSTGCLPPPAGHARTPRSHGCRRLVIYRSARLVTTVRRSTPIAGPTKPRSETEVSLHQVRNDWHGCAAGLDGTTTVRVPDRRAETMIRRAATFGRAQWVYLADILRWRHFGGVG
jgi:hypothetical protein